MPRDEATLLDIAKAARLAVSFVAGIKQEDFSGDVKTQSAVLHQLLLVGEAVKRLSADFKSRHPGVPWKMLSGMRDKLIHEYDVVDLREVWRTMESDVPALEVSLEPLLPRQDGK